MKRLLFSTFLMVLLAFPLASLGATLSLTKDGPRTAREGDLVEFSLEVVNEGTTSVAGIAVLDTLPAQKCSSCRPCQRPTEPITR